MLHYDHVRVILLMVIPASMQHGATPCRREPVALQLTALSPALLNRLLAILHWFVQAD